MQGWHGNVYRRLYYQLYRHVYCQGVPGCLLLAAGTPRSCLQLPLLGNQMAAAAAASPQQKPLVLETAAEAAAPSPPSRPGGAYAAPTCRGPKGRGGKGLASTEGTAPPHLRLGPTSCLPAHHCHIHTTHPHLVLAPGLAERQPEPRVIRDELPQLRALRTAGGGGVSVERCGQSGRPVHWVGGWESAVAASK